MASRVNRFYDSDSSSDVLPSRLSRNSRLYMEVYDKSGDLENLPLADNTKDIDINKLKELITSMDNDSKEDISKSYDDSFWDNKKRNIDNNKVYDINKMLEKAKYENSKLKDSESELLKTSRMILSKLDIDDNFDDITKEIESKPLVDNKSKDNLEMTRELKYHTKKIDVDPLIDQVMSDNDLAMDLFFDLKPTGDTIVTKPVNDNKVEDNEPVIKEIDTKNIFDTSDIDVIKKNSNAVDNDFFTSSYAFSKKDFSDDDDDFSDEKTGFGGVFKILFLVLGILLLVGGIIYFVINFGFGV